MLIRFTFGSSARYFLSFEINTSILRELKKESSPQTLSSMLDLESNLFGFSQNSFKSSASRAVSD